MTVYVDTEANPYGRMIMSHMWADDPDELHAMADRVGLKRRWFQTPDSPHCKGRVSFPHYDLCQSTRAKAIAAGAVVLMRRDAVASRRTIRERINADPEYCRRWRWDHARRTEPQPMWR